VPDDDGRIVALFNDQMDAETSNAFDSLNVDLRAVDERITAVDNRLTTVEARLSREIREEAAATRRHFDVVAESLRDDIRIVAEGLIALDAKVGGGNELPGRE
jgi:hypothetical protein